MYVRSNGPKVTTEVICNLNLCVLLFRNTINRTYPKHINIQPRHLQYFILTGICSNTTNGWCGNRMRISHPFSQPLS